MRLSQTEEMKINMSEGGMNCTCITSILSKSYMVTIGLLVSSAMVYGQLYQICGNDIPEALGMICRSYPNPQKRIEDNAKFQHQETVAVGKSMARQRKSIVHECCHSFCSIDTLRLYCSDMIDNPSSSLSRYEIIQEMPTTTSSTWSPLTPVHTTTSAYSEAVIRTNQQILRVLLQGLLAKSRRHGLIYTNRFRSNPTRRPHTK